LHPKEKGEGQWGLDIKEIVVTIKLIKDYLARLKEIVYDKRDYECSLSDMATYQKSAGPICGMNTIVLDVETTGMTKFKDRPISDRQEILQLAIVDIDGNILFSELFKPSFRVRWPKAQEVHGITPEMVKDKMLFSDHTKRIQAIFDEADSIAIFNARFDTAFLEAQGIRISRDKTVCVMIESAKKRGGRWPKLQDLADELGINSGKSHDALSDALTTLGVMRGMKII
jgi:DNA polymerase III epsilon subunit-like protein